MVWPKSESDQKVGLKIGQVTGLTSSDQFAQSVFKRVYLEFYNSELGVFYVIGKLRCRGKNVKEKPLHKS